MQCNEDWRLWFVMQVLQDEWICCLSGWLSISPTYTGWIWRKIWTHCLVSVLPSTDFSSKPGSKLIVVGHHSFDAYAPTLWNWQPLPFGCPKLGQLIIKHLKTYLFQQYSFLVRFDFCYVISSFQVPIIPIRGSFCYFSFHFLSIYNLHFVFTLQQFLSLGVKQINIIIISSKSHFFIFTNFLGIIHTVKVLRFKIVVE